jgi:hypothetical protein
MANERLSFGVLIYSAGNIISPNIVAKNRKAFKKNPTGVGTPDPLIMGTQWPIRPWTMRKVSGFAKIKNTRVL